MIKFTRARIVANVVFGLMFVIGLILARIAGGFTEDNLLVGFLVAGGFTGVTTVEMLHAQHLQNQRSSEDAN